MIANTYSEVAVNFAPHIIVCEEPTSMGIVGRTTNALGKLMYQVGYMKALFGAGRVWRWRTTNEWKGSLAQRLVVKRVNKLFSLNLKEDSSGSYEVDIAHAIGVGIYEIGSLIPDWEYAGLFGTQRK